MLPSRIRNERVYVAKWSLGIGCRPGILDPYGQAEPSSHSPQMRPVEELIDRNQPAILLLREWLAKTTVPHEVLPPSAQREEVLVNLQVTTRSPLGALAYETGGILLDHGWLRILGSGHPRLPRSLHSWNLGRSDRMCLVADDAAGGFFAINGDKFGPDFRMMYYWAPDSLEWEPLHLGFSDLLQAFIGGRMSKFYAGLRWPFWETDSQGLPGDHCFAFYPFLWAKEGSVTGSVRSIVPVSEAYALKADLARQLGGSH